MKKKRSKGFSIRHYGRPEEETAESKLSFLAANNLSELVIEELRPDSRGTWINQGVSAFTSFNPLISRVIKDGIRGLKDRSIFQIYSLGVSTNRDEWVYDWEDAHLEEKVRTLIANYEMRKPNFNSLANLKWSETLKRRSEAGRREPFSMKFIRRAAYRPFIKRVLYSSELFIDRPGLLSSIFPLGRVII